MLSIRGKRNAVSGVGNVDTGHKKKHFDKLNNPHGVVRFTDAENYLIHGDLLEYINAKGRTLLEPENCTHNEGSIGTLRLRTAMATHINETFRPVTEITHDHITFAAGVTALNQMCAFNLADSEEALLLGMPIYGQFHSDMTMTTGCNLLYAPFHGIDQFAPNAVHCYEDAIVEATRKGTRVKALVISNPHNPLGHCYPAETLKGLLSLCEKYSLHLISDEIYALSVFPTKTTEEPAPFTSILSIDLTDLISPNQVHVLYGMSKDFGAAGLRLGCLISRNAELTKATRAMCNFSHPSESSGLIAARLLEDRAFVKSFLHKNQTLLADAYAYTTQRLDLAGIPYYKGGNAGFFLWIDLSACLSKGQHGDSQNNWEVERRLSTRLDEAGVEISTGSAYHNEEPGWFRLVFTVDRDALEEGLNRIIATMEHFEA